MRRLLALALLILPLAASAQRATFTRGALGPIYPVGGVMAYVPFTSNGGVLAERATTKSHITFNNTTYVESIAATATRWINPTPKTPTAANVSPFYPGKAGISSVASSNRIAWNVGTDFADVTAFWGCAVVLPTSTGTKQCFLGNGNATTVGYHGCMEIGGACSLQAGTGTVTTANTMVVNGPNICCYGRDTAGTTGYVQLNGGTVASGAVTASVDTARAWNVISGNAGTQPWANGTIYEHIFHAETWDATGALDAFKQAFGIDGNTFIRSSVATNVVNGLNWTFPAGAPRINDQGTLIERALTANLYPTPAAPAAGTVTFTATGNHFFSVLGTGSQALTASGTLVATGLPCTATQASPCAFSVSSLGATPTADLAAVTGSLTCGQVEAGASRTSCTPAASRDDDVWSVPWPTRPMDINRWCIKLTAEPFGGAAWASGAREFMSVGTAASANSMRAIIASPFTSVSWRVYDSGAVLRNASAVHGFADGSSHTLSFVNNNGVNRWLDAGVQKATAGTPGTGLWSAAPATVTIGGIGTTGYVDAYIKDWTLYRSPRCF